MPRDHQLTFDWIVYAIPVPPVSAALWELVKTWKFASGDRKTLDQMYGRGDTFD